MRCRYICESDKVGRVNVFLDICDYNWYREPPIHNSMIFVKSYVVYTFVLIINLFLLYFSWWEDRFIILICNGWNSFYMSGEQLCLFHSKNWRYKKFARSLLAIFISLLTTFFFVFFSFFLSFFLSFFHSFHFLIELKI